MKFKQIPDSNVVQSTPPPVDTNTAATQPVARAVIKPKPKPKAPVKKKEIPVPEPKKELVIDNPYYNDSADIPKFTVFDQSLHDSINSLPVFIKKDFYQSEIEVLPVVKPNYRANYLVVSVLLISTIILIILQRYFKNLVGTILKSVINQQLAERLYREKNIMLMRVFLGLNLISTVVISLFIWIVLTYFRLFNADDEPLRIFYIILAVFLSFLIVRYILLIALGHLFLSDSLIKMFLHQNYLLTKSLAIILTPLLLCSYFSVIYLSDFFFYLTIFVAISMFLYRYIMAIQIILKNRVLIFYSILYLCTLEILPVLIGLKFIISLI